MGCLLEETSHPENAGQTLERDVFGRAELLPAKLRVSFLLALRVLRRRQRRKESERRKDERNIYVACLATDC